MQAIRTSVFDPERTLAVDLEQTRRRANKTGASSSLRPRTKLELSGAQGQVPINERRNEVRQRTTDTMVTA